MFSTFPEPYRSVLPGLVMLLLLGSGQARAEVYRWTDADGQVHFSDRSREQSAELSPLAEPGPVPESERLVRGIWAGSDELGNEHAWMLREDGTASLLVTQPGTTWRLSVEGRWKLQVPVIRIEVDAAQLTSRLGDTTGGLGWDVMKAEIVGQSRSSMTLRWNGSRVELIRQ